MELPRGAWEDEPRFVPTERLEGQSGVHARSKLELLRSGLPAVDPDTHQTAAATGYSGIRHQSDHGFSNVGSLRSDYGAHAHETHNTVAYNWPTTRFPSATGAGGNSKFPSGNAIEMNGISRDVPREEAGGERRVYNNRTAEGGRVEPTTPEGIELPSTESPCVTSDARKEAPWRAIVYLSQGLLRRLDTEPDSVTSDSVRPFAPRTPPSESRATRSNTENPRSLKRKRGRARGVPYHAAKRQRTDSSPHFLPTAEECYVSRY